MARDFVVYLFLIFAAEALVCLPNSHAQDLTIDNYVLISSVRVDRTVYEYTYTAELTNNSSVDYLNNTATFATNVPQTTVIDGNFRFPDVSAGGTVTSLDTFSFQQDRTYPMSWDDLVITITGYPDTDSDGVADVSDNCPSTANADQADGDGDGVGDVCDACSADGNKSAPGVCGCGVAETDSDGDSTLDCNDLCPNDPLKVAPGLAGCGNPERVSGTIRGYLNHLGTPLPGTIVRLSSKGSLIVREVRTNQQGLYVFSDVDAGTYSVSAIRDGVVVSRDEVGVSSGAPEPVADLPVFEQSRMSQTLYSFWNGFLEMVNILELSNKGDTRLTIEFSLLSANGEGGASTIRLVLEPKSKLDFNLNAHPGFELNAYGLVKLEASHDLFDGGVASYRISSDRRQPIDFSFRLPLSQSVVGASYLFANSYDPASVGGDDLALVQNWLSIASLASEQSSFEVRVYAADGSILETRKVVIPPLGRVDLACGHQFSQSGFAGLVEIVPANENTKYLAALFRYALDPEEHYSFAAPLYAQQGSVDSTVFPLTRYAHSRTFIEVGNINDSRSTFELSWYDSKGFLVDSMEFSLPSKGLTHLSVSELVGSLRAGTIVLSSLSANLVSAISSSYVAQADSRNISAVELKPPLPRSGSQSTASYNTYLNQAVWLRLFNLGDQRASSRLTIGGSGIERTLRVPAHGRLDLALHELGLSADTYGTISVESLDDMPMVGEVVRVVPQQDGQFADVISVPLR
jgi:hypothetical protein